MFQDRRLPCESTFDAGPVARSGAEDAQHLASRVLGRPAGTLEAPRRVWTETGLESDRESVYLGWV